MTKKKSWWEEEFHKAFPARRFFEGIEIKSPRGLFRCIQVAAKWFDPLIAELPPECISQSDCMRDCAAMIREASFDRSDIVDFRKKYLHAHEHYQFCLGINTWGRLYELLAWKATLDLACAVRIAKSQTTPGFNLPEEIKDKPPEDCMKAMLNQLLANATYLTIMHRYPAIFHWREPNISFDIDTLGRRILSHAKEITGIADSYVLKVRIGLTDS